MIAMPFHPSNTYTIEELNANLEDILHDCEKKAQVSFDGQVDFNLTNKIKNGKLYVDQGIIAGCAGGGYENICAAADILKGNSIGADEFTLTYILQVHLFMLNLQETADLQTLWRQVRLLRQHSADLVSVPEIHLPTTRFLSDIQQETSLTEKALDTERSGCFGCSYGCTFNRCNSG